MAEAAEGEILEGFLCPICLKDMRSTEMVWNHFKTEHPQEQDVLRSLKGLIGKAKNKILKFDDRETEFVVQKYYIEKGIPQAPGQIRAHTESFKDTRRNRLEHRTSETNKLIIRLEKFLQAEGLDRKQVAQELVAWLDGTTVTRCPSCAASFNLTRRQHHCRLCGSIMCNTCSIFLTYERARSIINPTRKETEFKEAKHKRDDAETLRICLHCSKMLESRRLVQIYQNMQHPICILYEQIQKVKMELVPNVEEYQKVNLTYIEMLQYLVGTGKFFFKWRICSSLISGESIYSIQTAQSIKTTIAKLAEILEILSKKIIALPRDPDNPREFSVQTAIRQATSGYLKDYILTLPPVPTRADIDELQKKRLQTVKYVEDTGAPVRRIKKVAVTTGWSPANVAEHIEHDNVIIEQIAQVKHFIQQAREAKRMDEVKALQENLEMLKNTCRANNMPIPD